MSIDEIDVIADEQQDSGRWMFGKRMKNCFYFRFRKAVFSQLMEFEQFGELEPDIVQSHALNLPVRIGRIEDWNWSTCFEHPSEDLMHVVENLGVDLSETFGETSIVLLARNKRGAVSEMAEVRPTGGNGVTTRDIFKACFDYFRTKEYVGKEGCCLYRSGLKRGIPTYLVEGVKELYKED